MPPGQTIPQNLSYIAAKKVCSAQDFERLACAFLSATETVNFDANKAAREFGGSKADSFKRSIWVITRKIKEFCEANGGDGSDVAGSSAGVETTPKRAKKTTAGVKKRKVSPEDDEEEQPKQKRGGAVCKKKKVSDEAAIVKTEAHEDEDSDGERDFLY